jgi:hypothetical protein
MCQPVSDANASPNPLNRFAEPILGLPAWGVRRGHSSFLTFEFGEPKLRVHEWQKDGRTVRSANVQGRWHLWIYCCHWRAWQDAKQLAWSEDANDLMDRAAAALDGQKLVSLSVSPSECRSTFTFDLGGTLETWPYGDDPSEEQWIILTETEAFSYRADGSYSHGPSDTPAGAERWLPLS